MKQSNPKRSFIGSAVTYHCPCCRQGKLFKEPFQLSSPLDMHKQCSHCELRFEPEPGFYFGAMFLSYALSSVLFLAIGLTMVFAMEYSVNQAMLMILFAGAIVFIPLLRFSRSLWIHMMVRYDGQYE